MRSMMIFSDIHFYSIAHANKRSKKRKCEHKKTAQPKYVCI